MRQLAYYFEKLNVPWQIAFGIFEYSTTASAKERKNDNCEAPTKKSSQMQQFRCSMSTQMVCIGYESIVLISNTANHWQVSMRTVFVCVCVSMFCAGRATETNSRESVCRSISCALVNWNVSKRTDERILAVRVWAFWALKHQ